MVAPLPKVGLLAVDLGTLSKNVEEIAKTVETTSKQLSAVQDQLNKQFDPKWSGSLAHTVSATKAKPVKIDEDGLILKRLITKCLARSEEETKFIIEIIERRCKADPLEVGKNDVFKTAMIEECNKPNVTFTIPDDHKINQFVDITAMIFK